MRSLRTLTTLAIAGSSVALAGCFDSDSSPVSGSSEVASDEEAIQVVLFEEESELADPDVRWFDDGEGGPALAPINTHAWRRELLSLDRTTEIVIENPDGEIPTASVTFTADATGLLHLWVCEEDDLLHLTKEFDDTGVRSLFFERTRERDRRHRGWKLVALSGVLIESDATTRSIRSVRVQAGDVDKTITNVTDLVRVNDLLTLPAGTEVIVTVDTGDATDSVFLHRRHARARTELTNNDDGTFSGRWITGERGGPRHVVVDVLSEGTLYDDVAPYDNVAWGIPLRIAGAVDSGE